jgi:hypothetical protein
VRAGSAPPPGLWIGRLVAAVTIGGLAIACAGVALVRTRSRPATIQVPLDEPATVETTSAPTTAPAATADAGSASAQASAAPAPRATAARPHVAAPASQPAPSSMFGF